MRRLLNAKASAVLFTFFIAMNFFALTDSALASETASESDWLPGRSTNDRDQDLVNALMKLGRFDDALMICQSRIRGAEPRSDINAKWAIQQSRVLVARQMGRDRFEDLDVDRATKPLVDLLTSYPDHPRKFFLLAQSLMVKRGAALHRVLRAAILPNNQTAKDQATISLLRTTLDLEALIRDLVEARILLEQDPGQSAPGASKDLNRLQQELQVETVSLALLQTELFPTGSDDCISAATRAEQIADEAITKLPVDTKARREVERLKVESILRAGQYDRAARQIEMLLSDEQQPPDTRWLALQTRLDLAQQRMDSAGARLAQYYGGQPSRAPRSIEMDLARLEFLLRSQSKDQTGDWLQAIQARGGDYAKRRAEAMLLELLGRSESSMMPATDPSIVAAQGQDYLRRGDPGRAADLLSEAARAETDPDRSIRYAVEAAAAFSLVQRYQQAAAILAEIALARPEADQAAAAHLQAGVLVATHDPQSIEQLESMLRMNLKQWPTATTASSIQRWLQKILVGQKRFVDAAEIIADVPPDQLTVEQVDQIEAQWRATLTLATEASSEISQRFLSSYQSILDNPSAANRFPLLVALLVDRTLLDQVDLTRASADDPFVSALLAFRRQGTRLDVLSSVPADLINDATVRLMRDGRDDPSLRRSIASLLEDWSENEEPSLGRAERLLWADKIDEAVDVLEQLIQDQTGGSETIIAAARLLENSGRSGAAQRAVELWDRLAAGTRAGTPLWHTAKLSGIRTLKRMGNQSESQRRAKYVLLTIPKLDESYRKQYQTFVD